MFEQTLKSYFKKIFDANTTGDAREESYYSTLEDLLKTYGDSIEKKKYHVTTLPKKTEAGNPDFRIWDGKQHIVGYIEAKSPTIEHLDQIETTDQLKRYLHIFPNLILTNFIEFRLYRDGALIDRVSISRPFLLHKLKTTPLVENETNFLKLLERFFSFSLPKVYDAKTLAIELAKRTRFLRDEVVMQELKEEERLGKGFISGFYGAFRQYLIRGLSKEEFTDLYSQTITYGLFAARTRSENGFNRKLAYDNIPRTIGILRDVFKFISLEDLPQQMEWIIDDISDVLAVTDVKNILHQYFHEGKGKDPIVHFYETFLAEYDPKTREKRGVYYTPEPVVSFIVHSLHHILKEQFDRGDGFANAAVTVLDPAAGTLTFLAEASKLAVEEFIYKYGEGGKENLIREQILRNFYAFELMMAPYAVGHLKMSFLLEELGYRLKKDDRFKLYLTNTLEMEELAQTELPGMVSLSEESHSAGKVKKEQPILVILGNPPYSGISANRGKWIDDLLKKGYTRADGTKDDGYYRVDGKPLGERNPKWLQDDYVKFIRYGQHRIEQTGAGILAFITNHGYLDNPTFRGMRQHLMKTFSEIYIVDLHGNSKKKEVCPDGSKDENVFDIQQGVSIGIFVKAPGESEGAKVFHGELWGLREKKYAWLVKNSCVSARLKSVRPAGPFYLFRPQGGDTEYHEYPRITDILGVNVLGFQTHRDEFAIDFDFEVIRKRIAEMRSNQIPDHVFAEKYRLEDNRDWKLHEVRAKLRKTEEWDRYIVKLLYRPFDCRYGFFNDIAMDFPRRELLCHVAEKDNLCLLISRQQGTFGFRHIWAADLPANDCVVSTRSREANQVFPLYLYPNGNGQGDMDYESWPKSDKARIPNLRREYVDTVRERVGMEFVTDGRGTVLDRGVRGKAKRTFGPEDVFDYIYGLLHSPEYRRRYAEFLKIDFPRIPIPKNREVFAGIAGVGRELSGLHLMRSSILEESHRWPGFPIEGGAVIEKRYPRYDAGSGRVQINERQYFEGIEPAVCEFGVGGYQVCEKWLKDRRGRNLSFDDINHYQKMVVALRETIRLMGKVDEVIDSCGGWPLG